MKKHGKILEYSLSSLLRRKYKNLAIIIVFSLLVALLSSVLFLTDSLKTEAFDLLGESPALIVQKVTGGRHDLIPTEYIKSIEEILGVKKARPRYWGYYYDYYSGGTFTIMEAGEDIEGFKMLDGDMPVESGEAAIGRGVADARLIDLDDILILTNNKLQNKLLLVTGVFTAKSEILTNDLIIMNREDVLNILGMSTDKATDILVEVPNESEAPLVAAKIRQALPDTRPIMKEEIIRTYEAVFNWRSGMILTMFTGVLIAFCILAWDKATGLSADERREIGILKAIGWETSDILELKFWEGIVISLTSVLTGLILGYIHIFLLGATFLAPALQGWSVVFPRFELTPYINPYQIFAMLFLIVVPYVASTIIPSWKSAITDPDAVMRQ